MKVKCVLPYLYSTAIKFIWHAFSSTTFISSTTTFIIYLTTLLSPTIHFICRIIESRIFNTAKVTPRQIYFFLCQISSIEIDLQYFLLSGYSEYWQGWRLKALFPVVRTVQLYFLYKSTQCSKVHNEQKYKKRKVQI